MSRSAAARLSSPDAAAKSRGPSAPAPPPTGRCHAQEVDLGAFRAVIRASEQGRNEGRRQALAEATRLAGRRARRERIVLALAVATALFAGFGAGVLVGALAPREPATEQPADD